MEDAMSLQELQQAVSVCMNEITRLSEENVRLTRTTNLLAQALKDVSEGLNEVIKADAQSDDVIRISKLQSNVSYLKNNERMRRASEAKNSSDGNIPFMGRGVVYSAITGNYDNVKEIGFKNPNFDYIMFTDNPMLKSNSWEVRLIDNPDNLDSVRLARRVKILGYEYLTDYDFSIWVDGKMEIVGDFEKYIHRYRGSRPMLCFNHFRNDCIYEEKTDCENMKADNLSVMDMQIRKYKKEGYPGHNGLIETAVLVRELHDSEVLTVMQTWWNEIMHYSFRDQLSFNYSCWKCGFFYDTSDLLIYSNDYVVVHAHN